MSTGRGGATRAAILDRPRSRAPHQATLNGAQSGGNDGAPPLTERYRHLDVIEKAIRDAFEKGDPGNRDFRVKVYRSAFTALDRALEGNAGVSPDAAATRREKLRMAITEIESEFVAAKDDNVILDAAEGVAAEDPAVETGFAHPPLQSALDVTTPEVTVSEPLVRSEARPAAGNSDRGRTEPPPVDMGHAASPYSVRSPSVVPEPRLDAKDNAAANAAYEIETGPDNQPPPPLRRRSSGGRLGRLLASVIVLAVLAAIVYGLWWALASNPFEPPAQRARDHPPATIDGRPEQAGVGQVQSSGASQLTIDVFVPTDLSTVAAAAGATANVKQGDEGKFLQIRSGASGAGVSFQIGAGIMQRIAGKRAVFDIVASSDGGDKTQMAVTCDFGGLGNCDRRRYEVGRDRNDYLLEVELPDGSSGRPGRIAINPDLNNTGKAADIYAIRVSIPK